MYNPVSRSYGEPHKRPEVQNATIEFIAPSEYMVGLQTLIAGFQHTVIVLVFNCHIWFLRAVIKMFFPDFHSWGLHSLLFTFSFLTYPIMQ